MFYFLALKMVDATQSFAATIPRLSSPIYSLSPQAQANIHTPNPADSHKILPDAPASKQSNSPAAITAIRTIRGGFWYSFIIVILSYRAQPMFHRVVISAVLYHPLIHHGVRGK